VSLAPPIPRLALLGGESSGKTTLAIALAQALGTVWVPEYGRQRWEELRETLSMDELVRVAQRQVQDEETLLAQASGWLVCDTTPLTTLQYCLYDHGQAPPVLWELARRPYALVLLCAPDFAFVQDGARRDDAFRAAQHAWTLQQLITHQQPWQVVSGTVAQRLAQVLSLLTGLPGQSASQPRGLPVRTTIAQA